MFTARRSASIAARRVLQRDVAEAALLMQAAEPRLQLLEAIEHRQGLVDAPEMAQADGGDQQQIAIFRQIADQRLRVPQGLVVPASPSAVPAAGGLPVPSMEAAA